MKTNENGRYYNNNPNVKNAGVQQSYSLDQVKNIQRYIIDPVAFINECVKVISIDHGIVPFNLFPYQKRIVEAVNNNRFTVCKLFRQSGKPFAHD